jgi:ribosomal protein L11 methyltransferase
MIEIFPEGFEEVESADGVELVAYTDGGGEERLWHAFGAVDSAGLEPGWETRWRDFHRPVRVGGLWIGPPWVDAPADMPCVVIDPGRAFGTGGHPTTRLCIELLGRVGRGAVLDVGCGSGVLSIAAVRLGFAPVISIDPDEHAVEATVANAAANGVELDVRRADATTTGLPGTDVAVVNVTHEVVLAVAPRLRCGTLIASGYLESGDPSLPGYRHGDRLADSGWAADVYTREAG